MAYYEMQCSREMREAYHAILKGALAVESAIRVPLLDVRLLSETVTILRLDHPEIFYFTGFSVRAVSGAEYGDLLPEYLFPRDKILAHRKAIEARAERLTRPIREKSQEEKLLFLHDFILENVRYDKLKKPYSHEVIGPLTQGVGVCEGIAKTVKLLADAVGLECIVALSDPEEGKRYGHTWNVVKCEGKWYQLDATFDLSLSACGEKRYDYFLLPDGLLYRDHRKPVYPVPECSDSGSFYYKKKKLSFTKEEELRKRIAQYAKKKKSHFVFHWRGDVLTRERIGKLCLLIRDGAAEGGRGAELSLNAPQAVFFVRFTEKQEEMEPVLESADEE